MIKKLISSENETKKKKKKKKKKKIKGIRKKLEKCIIE